MQINSTHFIDFLGLTIDSALTRQEHINKMTRNLNSACFVITSLKSILTIDLKIVYFAYVHSIITYDIVFWRNATDSKHVFIAKKRIIKNNINTNSKTSCLGFFKCLNILPFCFQYIFSLLLLVVKNMHLFVINAEIHTINTRQNVNLHLPLVKLAKYKKSTYYMGIVMFNHLPWNIRKLSNYVEKFRIGT
jgi:hypothetical protein